MIRVGVQVQPQHADFDGMRRAWREAEEMGADVVYTWDHFYPLYGEPEGKHFECLTTMASMAEVTERVEIGALVVCNSYRNPELLVDAHRTIDHISGGRAILGIGAGWFQRDYDEYGYEFGDAPYRLRLLGETLERVTARFAKLDPPPLDLPICVGGGGEKVTLRLVARHADMWHGFGDAGVFRRKNAILEEHCAAVGRDAAQIERSVEVKGTPEVEGELLVKEGATLFTVGVGGPDYDLTRVQEWVSWRDARA